MKGSSEQEVQASRKAIDSLQAKHDQIEKAHAKLEAQHSRALECSRGATLFPRKLVICYSFPGCY